MKKIFLFGFLFVLLLSITVVYAEDLCTDSDNGPKDGGKPTSDILTTRGSTKYGLTTVEDICVIGKDADVQAAESLFIKEYYCSNDKRESEIYDCTRYGFEKCKDGVCVGTGDSSASAVKEKAIVTDCGNKYLEEDKGEECDPPGSICLDGENYGQCMDNCRCKWHEQKDAGTETSEDNVADKAGIEESSDNYEVKAGEEEKTSEKEEDKFPIPDITIPDTSDMKNFSQEPGIKVTSGISGFFKKIFDWFLNLF